MRIGILGGTFNPMHNGHIAMAEYALKELNLDKVLFIPTYIPPHKDSTDVASAHNRMDMIRLAIKGIEGFETSSIEIDRKGISYSVDTAKLLKTQYPEDTEFFFLTGSDALKELGAWKDIYKLVMIYTFAVVKRIGYPVLTKYDNIKILDMEPVNISSTEIRRSVKAGEDIKSMVPAAVADYIRENKLYLGTHP